VRCQAKQDERRRKIRDERVLQQVDEQQALRRNRLERGVQRRRDDHETEREHRDAPA
jgi:hypothetical protein